MKNILYILGVIVVGLFAWRLGKQLLSPRTNKSDMVDPKRKAIDDSSPVAAYAIIPPPIAMYVKPGGPGIIMRRNDPWIPPQYTLPAMGPNGEN